MKTMKKVYTGIFRDGEAGSFAKRRFRGRRKKLMVKEDRLMAITGVPYGPGGKTTWALQNSSQTHVLHLCLSNHPNLN